MIYGSVCSGIGASEVAWQPLGWRCAFVSEIEKFPRAVLRHRLGAGSANGPALHGDFTTIEADEYEPIDILVGGTPCQSFSIAGLRCGLDDDRGNLALEYLRLAQRTRPRWLVWENVPGVLSSNGGRDFGSILGGLVELGYGFAYRVLDAQYVRVHGFARAVPQRRRRVFVVGYSGDWRRAAAVLFERESLSGHPAPRRKAGEGASPTISSRPTGGGGLGTDFDCDGELITSHDPACTLTAREYKGALPEADLSTIVAHPLLGKGHSSHAADAETYISHSLRADGFDASEDGTGRGTPLVPVAFDMRGREGGAMPEGPHDTANIRAASSGSSRSYVAQPYAVRRLTPRECERLQGFPDHYTEIPWRGKAAEDCPDGPRYKALGNAMAVNCMRWLGQRIEKVEAICGVEKPSHD